MIDAGIHDHRPLAIPRGYRQRPGIMDPRVGGSIAGGYTWDHGEPDWVPETWLQDGFSWTGPPIDAPGRPKHPTRLPSTK